MRILGLSIRRTRTTPLCRSVESLTRPGGDLKASVQERKDVLSTFTSNCIFLSESHRTRLSSPNQRSYYNLGALENSKRITSIDKRNMVFVAVHTSIGFNITNTFVIYVIILVFLKMKFIGNCGCRRTTWPSNQCNSFNRGHRNRPFREDSAGNALSCPVELPTAVKVNILQFFKPKWLFD